MEKEIKNEFGEKISEKEIERISKKIQKLSPIEIDDLWFRCGWIDSEKKNNRALPEERVQKIKKDLKFAKESLTNLFLETKKESFIRNLNKILEN